MSSSSIVAVLVALGSMGGLIGAVLSIFMFHETRRQKQAELALTKDSQENKERVDVIALGQSSLAAALARADLEIASLRDRISAAERRELDCWARVRALTERVEELSK